MRQLFVWNECSGEARGPFALSVVEELYESGVLEPQTLVAARGEDLWTSLSEHAYTSEWCETAPGPEAVTSPKGVRESLFARAQTLQETGQQGVVRHAAYDPDYELEFLELNAGKRRRLRDFALLAGGLNILIALGYLMLPSSTISAAISLMAFVGGNMSLSWLFGVVLRY